MIEVLRRLMSQHLAVSAGAIVMHAFWLIALAGLVHLVIRWCSARRSAASRYRIEALSFFVLHGLATLAAFECSTNNVTPHLSVSDTFLPARENVSDTMTSPAILGLAGWIWLVGTCVALARLTSDVIASRRAIRRIDALADGARSAAVCRYMFGRARVYISERFAEPMTVGFSRRALLLPRALLARPGTVRAAILRHENVHARSADPWLNLAQCLCESLLWFHPLVRSRSARLRLEREHRADAAAIAPAIDAPTLAAALLESVPAMASSSRLALTAALGLDLRIRRLTSSPAPRTPIATSLGRCGAHGLAAAVAFVVALADPSRHGIDATTPEVILVPPTLRAVESTGEQPPIDGGL